MYSPWIKSVTSSVYFCHLQLQSVHEATVKTATIEADERDNDDGDEEERKINWSVEWPNQENI